MKESFRKLKSYVTKADWVLDSIVVYCEVQVGRNTIMWLSLLVTGYMVVTN